MHITTPKHYDSTKENNIDISWKFGEVLTSFGCAIEVKQNVADRHMDIGHKTGKQMTSYNNATMLFLY